MPKIFFFIIILYFYLLNSAFGYDAEIKKFLDQFDSSNRIVLNEISILANKTPTELSKVGSSVNIYSKEEITSSESVYLVDFLDKVPGISVVRSGSTGNLSTVFIRGTSPYYSRVFVDGIDIGNPSGTQQTPSLSNFLTEDVESIEILKGSQSALYGTQAIGGVINIRTNLLKSKNEKNNKITLEYGSFDTKALRYKYLLENKSSEYVFDFYNLESEGFSALDRKLGATEKDGFENKRYSINGKHFFDDNSILGINLFSTDEYVETDDSFGSSDTSTYYANEYTQGIGLEYEKEFNNLSNVLNFSKFSSDRSGQTFSSYKNKGERTFMSYKGSSNLNDKITVVFGSDFIQDKTPTTNHENDIFGIFGEIIHQTSPHLNNTLAVRNDGHSAFGEQFSYRISSAYKLNKNANLKGSYGTGFRSPSLYELYDSVNGNADLKPEKSSNFDLEYTNNLSDNFRFTVAYFSNETEDVIDWVMNPPPNPNFEGKYTQTSAKKKREGIEISNIYNMNKSTSIDFSYSYTADDKGGKVIRVPRNQLGLNLGNQFNDKLYFNGSIKYNTDIIDSGNVKLEDYSLVNLLAKYELYENTNLKLRIENIFNNSYQVIDKFGTSPRAFYLSIDNAF